MKLKPVTLILVAVAVILGGVVAITQLNSSPETTTETEGTKLFAFEENQVKALKVQTQLRSLQFQKDNEGEWQMQQPDQGAASDASIAYLLNLLATGRSDRVLTVPASNREEYGFHQPMATIDVTLDNNETHRLIVGGYDFNRSSIYAQVDPPDESAEELQVLLVSPDFDNAVNRSLAEWKAEAESPSPSPIDPSPTPSTTP